MVDEVTHLVDHLFFVCVIINVNSNSILSIFPIMVLLKKQFLLVLSFFVLHNVGTAQDAKLNTQSAIYWYVTPCIGGGKELKPAVDNDEGLLGVAIEAGIFSGRNQYSMQARSVSGGSFGNLFQSPPPNAIESINDVSFAYQYKILSFDNVLNLSLGGGMLVGGCNYRGNITATKSTGGFFSFSSNEYAYRHEILFGVNSRASIDLLFTRYIGFTISSQVNLHRHPEMTTLFGLKFGDLRGRVPSDKGKPILHF